MTHLNWLLCVAVFCTAFPLTGLMAEEEYARISVTGKAEILVVPDRLILTASIDSKARTVKDAVAENQSEIKQVLDFLRQSGVESKHIQTQQIRINPIYEGTSRKPLFTKQQSNANDPFNAPNVVEPAVEEKDPFESIKPIGYEVKRDFAITLIDLDKFESIYQGIIERGINKISDIDYSTSELRKHRDAARLQAVQAARQKAEAMATTLGAKLASIQSIAERGGSSSYRSQNVMIDPFGGPEEPSTFAAGRISISAEVDVAFRLGETEITK